MEIQLFDGSFILPHSSHWDSAFPGFNINPVPNVADDDDDDRIGGDGKTFTDLDSGITYRMPEGGEDKVFFHRHTLWRATSKTNPAETFLFVTWDSGNGWETFEATDDVALFTRAFDAQYVEPWATASASA